MQFECRFNVDMTQFPTVNKVLANLDAVQQIRKAHPSRQPDTPEPDRAND
jgi:hypothetical protein